MSKSYLALASAMLILAACRRAGPLEEEGIIDAALTEEAAVVATVTPAPFPTVTPFATATLRPTPTQAPIVVTQAPALPPSPVPNRILFDLGATSYGTSGFINARSLVTYAMQVSAGQLMLVNVSSPANDVVVGMAGASGGQTLQSTAAGRTSFTGVAPSSQDYIVQLLAGGTGGNFTLGVNIPVRINFPSGSTSTSVQGQVPAADIFQYVMRVSGGQPILLEAISPGNNVVVAIFGVTDGQPLQRIVAESSTFSGAATITQDYVISLDTLDPAGSDFTLNVTIPARISFAAGAISASVDGSVQSGGHTDYVLRAGAGQTMSVSVTSAANDVVLAITGADDSSSLVSSSAGANTFSGTLPATQDYIIQVISVGGDTAFTLDVVIT